MLEDDGVVRGIRYRSADGMHEVCAKLVVGADGRFSKVRQLAGLRLVGEPEPLDLLWVRLPRSSNDPERAHGVYLGRCNFAAVMARDADWQVGYVFQRGTYQQVRNAGLETLRQSIADHVPFLYDRVHHLQSRQQTSLLQLEVGRVPRWHAGATADRGRGTRDVAGGWRRCQLRDPGRDRRLEPDRATPAEGRV